MNITTLESYKHCLIRMYVQNPVLMGEILKDEPNFDWSNKSLNINTVFTDNVESTEELEDLLPEYLAKLAYSYGYHELYFQLYTWLHQTPGTETPLDLSKHAGHLVFNKTSQELFVCESKTSLEKSHLPLNTFSPPVLRVHVTQDASNNEALETISTSDNPIGPVIDFGNMNPILKKLSPLLNFQNSGQPLDVILQGTLRWVQSQSEMIPTSSDTIGSLMETVLQRNLQKVSQVKEGLEKQLQPSNSLADLKYSLQTALLKSNGIYFLCMWDICKKKWAKYHDNAIEHITEETLSSYLNGSEAVVAVWLMYIRQDYWIALNASSLSMANTDHPSSNYIDNSAVPNGSNDSAYAETYEYYDDMADDEVYDIIACHICNNGDSDPGNQILLCDGCNGAIHQLCQIPVITETEIEYDPWYCIKCWRARNPPVSVDGMDDLKRRRIE